MTEQGPTTRQRRLCAELRRLREAADLKPEDAAGALGWSRPKLVKIETASVMPKVAEVERILNAYGGPNEAVKLALMKLARDAWQRGWWTAYGDVLSGSYAELEDAAHRIRIWQVQLIPGLLQTEEYARSIIASGFPSDPDEVERRVQARMHRQTLLTRRDAPTLEVILAEEVLHRPSLAAPPTAAMMRGQLQHLTAMASRPNVSFRILPVSSGHYPGVGQGPMVIFEFPGAVDLSVAYMETMAGARYEEDITRVRESSVAFDRIADVAMSNEESAELISAIVQSKE